MERFSAKTKVIFFMELLAGEHGKLEAHERGVIEQLLAEYEEKLARLDDNPTGVSLA